MERIYLDNNATTMVDPGVFEAMRPFFSDKYGNSSSLHSFGTETHPPLEKALDLLYSTLGADDEDDLIINSCATEGNNTVLQGIFNTVGLLEEKKKIIISSVEHPAVSHTCDYLEKLGAEIVRLPVDKEGITTPVSLERELDPKTTALVSIMWANNETGLINPIPGLAKICRERGVLFHTDAVQAIGKIPVNVKESGVDFLTFSAHKFHGPKGVGGLWIRNGVDAPLLLHGGEQMGGKRAGTVNVPFFIGMAEAMHQANTSLDYEKNHVRRLRDKLEDYILSLPGTLVIGNREKRTPNTILSVFSGIEGEAFIWDLNQAGIAASTGSACSSEDLTADPTLEAMNLGANLSHSAVRFSLSRFTTETEIDRTIEAIDKTVNRLRSISTMKISV